jgi:hypothetical protein
MLSTRDRKGLESKVISLLRKKLKSSPLARRLCDKYNEELDFIDTIPIEFQPLDVSAKTVNGRILLNSKLLEGEFRDNMRYMIHEFVHCLQQENGDVGSDDGGDYLDDPHEMEAFWFQIEGMGGMYSPEEVQEYLEGLLDHHGLEGKERDEKKEELTSEEEPEKPGEEEEEEEKEEEKEEEEEEK